MMSESLKRDQRTFSALCIRRPVLTLVMSAFMLVLGGVAYTFLGVREFPAVNPPTITVTTSYAGASAEVIETQITEPIESSINGVDGIRNLNSVSQEGRSQVTVEFDISSDLDAAANDVRDRVSRVLRQLPADADPPTVAKADANSFPILLMTVQSDKRDLLEVNAIGNRLKERLETIPGVAEVRIWGERKYAMRILLDPQKLAGRGLTLDDVRNALRQDNVQLPSGRLEGPQVELSVLAPRKLSTPEQFGQIVLSAGPEGMVRLRDVGRVVMGSENERTLLRKSGVPMVGLGLVSQPNANALDIAREFYKRFEQLKAESPEDVKLELGFDSTRFINRSILEVRETIAIAFVLVMLVLFLFLRDWRSALIPAFAIPISLVGAFFVMYLAGFTINVLTLLAMVLAIGLVVDDAIVVLEAIYARVEKGESPMQAAFRGSREIFFAIVATTLVLVVIFLPVVFMGGFTGRLFREFGIVLAGSVVISAFVSLTLTPMLSSRWLKKPADHSFYHRTEPFFEGMSNAYRKTLDAFMKVRWVAPLLLLGAIAGTAYFFITLKRELAPLEDRSVISIIATAPEGTSFTAMDATMVRLSAMLGTLVPEADALAVTSPQFVGGGGSNGGFFRLLLVDPKKRERSQQEIAAMLGGVLRSQPDIRAFANQEATIQVGPRSGLPVQFVILAPEFEKLREALPKFLEAARKDPTFVVVDENLRFNRPQLRVEVDRDRARALGVSVGDVAQALQLAYGETRADYFIKESRQYSVIGQLEGAYRDEPSDMLAIPVRNRAGELIPLSNLVKVSEISGPPQLYRFNRYVSATVSAGLAPGKTIGDGIAVMNRIANETLTPAFSTALTGSSRDFAESQSSLQFAFLMALLMVYLALAAQFESFRHPFTVMLTVPLALFGALASLAAFGHTLNLFSQIGLIMLIGLVTKNGILIVEFANQRREQGMDVLDAVSGAAASRFRPIIMTTLTTTLGILPIALGLGGAAQSRVPMGVAVVGGLLFSLILTLYLIPALYFYLAGAAPVAPVDEDSETDDDDYAQARIAKQKKSAGPATGLANAGFGTLLPLAAASLLGLAVSVQANAWPTDLQSALTLAEQRHPNVLAEKQALQRAHADATWGTTGLWPKVDATSSANRSWLDSRQERAGVDGQTSRDGAKTTQYAAGVNGTWTVFEGLKSPAQKQRLDLQAELAALRLAEVTLEVRQATAYAFYAVMRDRELWLAADTLTQLTGDRLKLVQARRASGSVSRQEELEAEADAVAQQAMKKKAEASLLASLSQLGQWVGYESTTGVQAEMALAFANPGDPVLREVKDPASVLRDSSLDLRRSRLAEKIAASGFKESLAELWPKVSVTAGYNYALTRAEQGVLTFNETTGPSVGAQLRWNLFDGGSLARDIKKAKALERETGYRAASTLSRVQSEWNQVYAQARGCLEALELERRNRSLSAEAARLMQERLRAGAVSQVEAHLSEERYIAGVQRAVGQLFECRQRELQLARLTGF